VEDLFLCDAETDDRVEIAGDAVFIAHGRSSAWWELKEYLQNILFVKHIAFNSDVVTGYMTHERLIEMLGRSK
jgi:hypothetical protein